MFAHESLIRFFCETNRLYETTPAIASTTTIANTTQRTSTFRSLSLASAEPEAYPLGYRELTTAGSGGQLASIRVSPQSNREYDRDVCPFESVDSS